MIKVLKKINTALAFIKFDLHAIFCSIFALPRYFADRRRFNELQRENEWVLKYCPILLDRNDNAASLGEYFWQDIFVAKEIIKRNPNRHIDIGSRIDGFIAHLACVREVEVFDIRPLKKNIENVAFTQWDITSTNLNMSNSADCVTCLHTLEHIGLGRYGDQIDPDGWKKGLEALVSLVQPGGVLWLSVPIGVQRIEFNAHRIFHPDTIVNSSMELGVTLSKFYYLTDSGLKESVNIHDDFELLAQEKYGLGIFLFHKKDNENP